MKKNYISLYILGLFMVLSNIPCLYAVEGFGVVDTSLDPGDIGIDDRLHFVLNDVVYVRNLKTEEGTKAIVATRFYDSSIEARLSREIAGKIGIPEAEGGRVEILSVDQAIARGFIDLDSLEDPQDTSTLPTKLANVGGSLPNPPPDSKAPSPQSSPEVPPEPTNPPAVASGSPGGSPPQISSPSGSGASSSQGAGFSIKDKPTPDKTLETTLPVSPIFAKGDEALAIRDVPQSHITENKDNPQISLLDIPPSGLVVSDGGSLNIKEEPVLEKSLVTPETNLPDRGPLISQGGDETPAIREKPGLADIATAPEITLPAENPWNIREPTEPRISEGPPVNTNLSPGNPWSYPEITLPAENLWDTKGSEAPRINDTPKVNETNLSQKSPRVYNTDEYDIALIPAEKRPPAERGRGTMPPEGEIAPIPQMPPQAVMSGLPPEGEIPPIPKGTWGRGGSGNLDPALAVGPIENGQYRSVPSSSASSASGSAFSVPLITTLEKGKYYVQLAALSKSELVEPELSKIGKSYPLAIQTIGSQDHPLYRILLGPINRGESGALLQRFKGIGYADAFVRQGS